MELAVQQVRNAFEIEYGSSIEEFLDSIYLAGANIGGSKLEYYAKSIERSNKMLTLLSSAVYILRSKHKHGFPAGAILPGKSCWGKKEKH